MDLSFGAYHRQEVHYPAALTSRPRPSASAAAWQVVVRRSTVIVRLLRPPLGSMPGGAQQRAPGRTVAWLGHTLTGHAAPPSRRRGAAGLRGTSVPTKMLPVTEMQGAEYD